MWMCLGRRGLLIKLYVLDFSRLSILMGAHFNIQTREPPPYVRVEHTRTHTLTRTHAQKKKKQSPYNSLYNTAVCYLGGLGPFQFYCRDSGQESRSGSGTVLRCSFFYKQESQ